jgi:hypothetical protein
MSIEPAMLLTRASDALDRVIAAVRHAPEHGNPGILLRIGRLDTLLAAARQAAAQGKAEASVLLANGVLRGIAQDFPDEAVPGLGPVEEDQRRRTLAMRLLQAGVAP